MQEKILLKSKKVNLNLKLLEVSRSKIYLKLDKIQDKWLKKK